MSEIRILILLIVKHDILKTTNSPFFQVEVIGKDLREIYPIKQPSHYQKKNSHHVFHHFFYFIWFSLKYFSLYEGKKISRLSWLLKKFIFPMQKKFFLYMSKMFEISLFLFNLIFFIFTHFQCSHWAVILKANNNVGLQLVHFKGSFCHHEILTNIFLDYLWHWNFTFKSNYFINRIFCKWFFKLPPDIWRLKLIQHFLGYNCEWKKSDNINWKIVFRIESNTKQFRI